MDSNIISLNPCFNGRYSLSLLKVSTRTNDKVLILVLMEDTLWARVQDEGWKGWSVLILVLMEDTLWVKRLNFSASKYCLNPCFNGRYSLRLSCSFLIVIMLRVLILVLMEDTLWELRLVFLYIPLFAVNQNLKSSGC